MFCAVFIFVNVAFTSTRAGGAAPLIQLNDGYKMPAIALGTWLGNSSTGRIKPVGDEVENAVLWAIEAGYRHVDTAWAYNVEDQVGRVIHAVVEQALRQQTTTPRVCDVGCYLKKLKDEGRLLRENGIPVVPREELYITTKLWNSEHAKKAVVPALRASLAQLQLSYVDLYLIHWPVGQFANMSYDYTHYLETWRGMMQAQGLGLTRSIGVSNFNKSMLEEIRTAELRMPAVLQVEWNLNLQQSELLAYCRQQNITVMGYTPFGSMFPSRSNPGTPPPRVNDPALKAIAAKHNKTVPQIVLRYAVEMGVVPIPKSIKRQRIVQNINIFDFALEENDKHVLRRFDNGYRTLPQYKWVDHPYYPFEIPANIILAKQTTHRTTAKTQTTTPTTRTARHLNWRDWQDYYPFAKLPNPILQRSPTTQQFKYGIDHNTANKQTTTTPTPSTTTTISALSRVIISNLMGHDYPY